jgi:hypothetical protein
MPLNREMFNENLQQVVFLYTSDLKSWKYANGRVVKLPMEDKVKTFLPHSQILVC